MKLTEFVNEINELNEELTLNKNMVKGVQRILSKAGYLTSDSNMVEQVQEVADIAKGKISIPESMLSELKEYLCDIHQYIGDASGQLSDLKDTASSLSYDAEEADSELSTAKGYVDDAQSSLRAIITLCEVEA